MAQMPDIGVTAVDAFFGGRDRHVMLGGIVQGIFTRADVPLSPGGDNLEPWVEGLESQLKTDLIVAFTGAAVRHSIGAFDFGNLHLPAGDERSRERGA